MSVFLISGCSRGLGYEMVSQLSETGDTVIATCRNPDGATKLNEIAAKSPNIHVLTLDVTDEKSIDDCVAATLKITEHVDVLVNNASVVVRERPDPEKFPYTGVTTYAKELNESLLTNVTAVHMVTLKFLPLIKKSANPKVINVSSMLGSCGENPKMASKYFAYGVSKAAVNKMTVLFANELPDVIFVSLHPGWVNTGLGNFAGQVPPIQPKDSVEGQLKVIRAATKEQSGRFLTFNGGEMKW